MPTSFSNKHALPPVGKCTTLQRSLQYIVPHPEPAYCNQVTEHAVLPRTDSLPPPYNDLFGIETVPCSQNQSSSGRSSAQLPPTRPVQASAPAFPNNARETDRPSKILSPEEQLQQLLKQMLPQSQSSPTHAPDQTDKRHKTHLIVPSKPVKPPAYAATETFNNYLPVNKNSRNNNNNNSAAEWDDQRAQDLFLQLCRL